MADRPLNPKQERFVQEYLIDLNATQAAIRAGYSVRTANEQGSQLLAKLNIAEAIARAQAERADRVGLTADRVLEELAVMAFAHMGQFASWHDDSVSLIDSSEVDPRAVAEVSQRMTRYGNNVGIKLHDKLGTLKLLGQHLGLFADRVEHSGQIEVVQMETARTVLRVVGGTEHTA